MMMMVKREREVDSISMANYLMMLSGGSSKFEGNNYNYLMSSYSSSNSSSNRMFECKTCNRQFSSFQALGGHRASHKKPRLMEGSDNNNSEGLLHGSSSPPKPKTHECSVCGLEFAIGQALGGHMRRHRSSTANSNNNNNNNGHYVVAAAATATATTTTTNMRMMSSSSGGSISVDNNSLSSENNENGNKKKRSSSVLFLDLNLTPFENDLEFLKIGQPATTTTLLHCFN